MRQVMERLSRQVHLPVAPYDDPYTDALRLWRLRRESHVEFDVSAAALDVSAEIGERAAEELRMAYRSELPAHAGKDQISRL